jgi:hypothetical protein
LVLLIGPSEILRDEKRRDRPLLLSGAGTALVGARLNDSKIVAHFKPVLLLEHTGSLSSCSLLLNIERILRQPCVTTDGLLIPGPHTIIIGQFRWLILNHKLDVLGWSLLDDIDRRLEAPIRGQIVVRLRVNKLVQNAAGPPLDRDLWTSLPLRNELKEA